MSFSWLDIFITICVFFNISCWLHCTNLKIIGRCPPSLPLSLFLISMDPSLRLPPSHIQLRFLIYIIFIKCRHTIAYQTFTNWPMSAFSCLKSVSNINEPFTQATTESYSNKISHLQNFQTNIATQ